MSIETNPMSIEETIVSNVTRRREQLKVSKSELARRMGVQRSQIIRWENGTHVPDHHSVMRIATALDTPWQWFYEAHDTSPA